jgi:hypothetical protein
LLPKDAVWNRAYMPEPRNEPACADTYYWRKEMIPMTKEDAETGVNPVSESDSKRGRDYKVPDAMHEEVRSAELDRDDLDPFEINFLPEFEAGRGPRHPFVNEYGVVIGDHDYQSPDSPLMHWDTDTDPSVMAGDEWVHPYKDIGFHTAENRDYFERGIPPQSGIFMHPSQDVAYEYKAGQIDPEQESET